jgi:hypothetical protein
MRYLAALLLLLATCSAQAAHSVPMAPERVQVLMRWAADTSHRAMEPVPPVYLVDDWALFQKMVCRYRVVACGGLGSAAAIYDSGSQVILVNVSIIPKHLDAVIVHELVHHLQTKQHDNRSCIDREVEAYQAQALYGGDDIDVYYAAGLSCSL